MTRKVLQIIPSRDPQTVRLMIRWHVLVSVDSAVRLVSLLMGQRLTHVLMASFTHLNQVSNLAVGIQLGAFSQQKIFCMTRAYLVFIVITNVLSFENLDFQLALTLIINDEGHISSNVTHCIQNRTLVTPQDSFHKSDI